MRSHDDKIISVFHHHPFCSSDSAIGVCRALQEEFTVEIFGIEDLDDALERSSMIVFPGGIGDSDEWHKLFAKDKEKVKAWVERGGKYLGICMGAYWADHNYFDLLKDLSCVQSIKQPETQTTRSYGTVVDVMWMGEDTQMYFYDGCAIRGSGQCEVFAKYKSNHDWAAVVQDNVGVIGPHPESTKDWFTYKTHKYMKNHWHGGKHWRYLRDMVHYMLEDNRNC